MGIEENGLPVGSQVRPPTAAGGSKKRPCKRTPKKGCRVIDMRKPTERLSLPLETIEDYCINCVTWEEAKPFVDLLEKHYGQDAPPKVKAIIRRIKKNFRKLMYQAPIHCQYLKMDVNVNSPGNFITRNIKKV